MKSFAVILVTSACFLQLGQAADIGQTAWELEAKGDAAGARACLHREAQSTSASPEILAGLRRIPRSSSRSGSPRSLRASAPGCAQGPAKDRGEPAPGTARRLRRRPACRRTSPAAIPGSRRHPAGPSPRFVSLPPEKTEIIAIPGPLRSFARMAALSPDMHPEDLMPALARNIVTNGYQATAATRLWNRPST